MNVHRPEIATAPKGAHTPAMSKSAAAAVGGVVWQTPVICAVTISVIIGATTLAAIGAMPFWVTILLNWWALFALYTPLHEAVHGNISGRDKSKAWLDKLVGSLAGFFLSVPYGPHKTIHLTHHRHTNDPKHDPDHWVKGKTVPGIFFRCMSASFGYLVYCVQHWENPEMRRAFWGTVGGMSATAIVLTALGQWLGWQVPVFGYLVPAVLAITTLAFLFDWIVHTPHEVQDRFANTRVLETEGPLDTVVTWLDLQQNYHGVHHAFPKIPFTKYRAFFRANREDITNAGLPVERY